MTFPGKSQRVNFLISFFLLLLLQLPLEQVLLSQQQQNITKLLLNRILFLKCVNVIEDQMK